MVCPFVHNEDQRKSQMPPPVSPITLSREREMKSYNSAELKSVKETTTGCG